MLSKKFVSLGLIAVLAVSAAGLVPQTAWARPYSARELQAAETSTEAQIRELRDQEITELRVALGRRAPTHRRADLYLRLAELYLEAYHAEFLLEGRVHDTRLSAGQKDTYINREHSKVYLYDGIKACRAILSFGIPYDHMDQVYYFLAFNYGELGDHKQSLEYFSKLIHKFPGSPMVSEGYRELANSAYQKRDFRKAQRYYTLAANKAPADTKPMILEKLAWAYYRTRNFNRAVEVMKQVVTLASASGQKFVNLREGALRDMAIFMTEADRAPEALQYFQKVAGDKTFYPKLLEQLGAEYEHNVQPAKATQVYLSLLKTNPDPQTRFRVIVKLVDLDLRRGQYQAALNWVHQAKDPGGDDTNTQVAAQNLRAMVRRTATENHQHYRKTHDHASLLVAEAYYQTYLNQFLSQDDPHHEIPEIEMYLAEVERDLGKSKEASDLYRNVVQSRDPRYAKEAGALWTASLSEAIHKESVGGAKKTNGAQPSALEEQYIQAASQLQASLGNSTEGLEAGLKAAQVEAGYSSTQQDAIKRIQQLIQAAPSSSQALTAARLWIQIDSDRLSKNPNASGDLKDAIAALRGNDKLMAADRKIGKGKLGKLLGEQNVQLKVDAIAQSEKEKNYLAAARGYESFAQGTKNRKTAEKAYSSALADFARSGDMPSVDRVSLEWLKRYPGSEQAIAAIRGTATELLIEGQFEAAAGAFAKLGRFSHDPASLETAARIFDGIGKTSEGETLRTEFLKRYPRSRLRPRITLDLAKAYDSQRADSRAGKYYQLCSKIPQLSAECGARLGDLYVKGEDWASARRAYERVSALGRRRGFSSPWIGYARFQLASRMEKQAHFDALELPQGRLKKAMEERTAFLERLSRAYRSAVEAGGPWAVASLDALANWGARFADEIDAIAPPAKSSAKMIAQFKKSLKGLSNPIREKSIATWREAYSKAVAAESFSPALPDIADHLADFRTSFPMRAQGFSGKFRLAGLPADGGTAGQDSALKKIRAKLEHSPQDATSWVNYGNLIWGQGKPVLAKLVYDYALTLDHRNAGALNNRGVVAISNHEENWVRAYQAASYFKQALKTDNFFLSAKMNLAVLMNYYRLFAKAKPYWDQVNARVKSPDVALGRAIALQGLGKISAAEAEFRTASKLGGGSFRFVEAFHRAARQSFDHAHAGLAAKKCLGTLKGLGEGLPSGFEKNALDNLKRACTKWSRM